MARKWREKKARKKVMKKIGKKTSVEEKSVHLLLLVDNHFSYLMMSTVNNKQHFSFNQLIHSF